MDAVGGQLLEVNGIAKWVPLTEPDDVIQLDNQYCDLLIDYCKSRIRLKEGGQPFQLASVQYQEFIRKVKAWTVWQGMRFPRWYLAKEEEPSEGKGT